MNEILLLPNNFAKDPIMKIVAKYGYLLLWGRMLILYLTCLGWHRAQKIPGTTRERIGKRKLVYKSQPLKEAEPLG